MKLKAIKINSYLVLVDESAEIKEGEKFCHLWYKDQWKVKSSSQVDLMQLQWNFKILAM